jgi:hypothetical protein
MARPVSSPNDQAATLRNLKVLVVLLIISNLVVGALSVYLLRAVDRRYSELINRTAPVLNDLQTLTAKSTSAMRTTNLSFFENPADGLEAALQRSRAAIEVDRVLREKLLKADWLPSTAGKRQEFQQTGAAFTQLSQKILGIYATKENAEATRVREKELRPVFERYQESITKIADVLLDESNAVNDDYSTKTNRLSTVVLGVASWPVILLLGLLLLTAIFVLAMMVAFRGKDLADMP